MIRRCFPCCSSSEETSVPLEDNAEHAMASGEQTLPDVQMIDREQRKWISQNLTVGSEVTVELSHDFQLWKLEWKITESYDILWSFHVVNGNEKLYLTFDNGSDLVKMDAETNEQRFISKIFHTCHGLLKISLVGHALSYFEHLS